MRFSDIASLAQALLPFAETGEPKDREIFANAASALMALEQHRQMSPLCICAGCKRLKALHIVSETR